MAGLDRQLVRDIALICVADGFVGLSFGAITVSAGLPVWLPMLLSLVVFAGAAQFLFVGLVASGGNPIAAVVAGLLVNARHVPFGFAVGDVLGDGWLRRLVGSHLMIDETVAFALGQQEPERRRAAYWTCGTGLFLCWNVGVLAGAFGGTVVTDTDAFGLDAAFPAVLLALVLPSLKDRATRRAVLVGVVVALATAPFLQAGLPVLLALLGVLVALRNGDAGAPAGTAGPAKKSGDANDQEGSEVSEDSDHSEGPKGSQEPTERNGSREPKETVR